MKFRAKAGVGLALFAAASLVTAAAETPGGRSSHSQGTPHPAASSAASHAPNTITHGQHLVTSATGPTAIAGPPLAPHIGDVIRDGRSYPFARLVERSAGYDGFLVDGPHLLIENAAITGPVDIFTRLPVVMRRVRVTVDRRSDWGVHVRPAAGPFFFLWSEVGAGSTLGAPADRSNWLARALYLTGDRAVVYRSHVTRAADGIQVHGVGTRVIETVIDELVHWQDDHNDGIQMLGRAADLVVARCRIENRNPLVAAINTNGQGARIDANYLAGGGYTLYGGERQNGHGPGTTRDVVVTDNIFGRRYFPKVGKFGPVTYWDATPGTGNIWRSNRYDNGDPIADPVASAPSARRR